MPNIQQQEDLNEAYYLYSTCLYRQAYIFQVFETVNAENRTHGYDIIVQGPFYCAIFVQLFRRLVFPPVDVARRRLAV